MATHDYIISNASGAAVRSDLNNALAAIVSNNSSATEPATTYAYMWWADTTAGQLKLRNAANSDWVVLLELDGTTLMEDGTVSAPGLAFADDTNTGFYRPAADSLAIATAGTNAIYINSSQQVGIGTTSASSQLHIEGDSPFIKVSNTAETATGIKFFDSADETNQYFTLSYNAGTGNGVDFDTKPSGASYAYRFIHAGSERLRIDSSGNVGIGTSSPQSLLHLSNTSQIRNQCTSTTNAISFWKDGTPSFAAEVGCGSATGIASALKFDIYNGSSWNTAINIDSSSNVGIGTTSPDGQLHVAGAGNAITRIQSTDDNQAIINFSGSSGTALGQILYNVPSNYMRFYVNSSESARIDSSGRLLVGATTARSNVNLQNGDRTPHVQIETSTNTYNNGLSIINNSADGYAPQLTLGLSLANGIGSNGNVAPTTAAAIGMLNFVGNDGDQFLTGARIEAVADGVTGNGDMPGRLMFSTTADGASSPTERMRITQKGGLVFAQGVAGNNFSTPAVNTTKIECDADVGHTILFNTSFGSARDALIWHYNSTRVGSIQQSTTSVSYNTSSDYRLKENVTAVTDGITRLQQLKPSRFNFIADPTKTVDGFLAHEVQDIVPEAITGTKDEVDENGDPVYQGIDQSKLVPLLTAALQEAIAKIETLEAKVAALESA